MEDILELMKKVSSTELFVCDSSIWVDVTYIENPHRFFVRPRIYRHHLSAIQEHGPEFNFKYLYPATRVIFKSRTVEKEIRGLVLSKQNNVCEIYAMDYGFTEKDVQGEDIFYPLADDLVPPLATLCKLGCCYPLGGVEEFSPDAIEAMQVYVGKDRAKIIVKRKSPEALVVQLINSTPEDVAHLMALTGYTHLLSK